MGYRILSILGLLLLATSAFAQWRAEGEVVPDTEWRKSSGDFGAMLLVTNDPDSFFEAWSRPPSPDYKPTIETSAEAHRGDNVVGVVVFLGCAPDDSGNCRSDMDLRLLYPDGSVYGEFKDAEVWLDKTAPPAGNLQVSVANLGLRVEPDDPFGTYRFEAVVRDRVANKKLELVQLLEVVPAKEP